MLTPNRHLKKRIQVAVRRPEQRWPVLIALAAIGGLYLAMPKDLLPFPDHRLRFVPLGVVLVTAAPLIWTHRKNNHRVNAIVAHSLLAILTFFMMASVVLLVQSLPHGKESGAALLQSAASLWTTNVLVFACWYWRLDAGGPHARASRNQHEEGAFLFPQMTMTEEQLEQSGHAGWHPGFVDYLFLAFNTSTALSPADTAVLGRWAKVLMMMQATISFTVIILLAARAVNILPGN
jgi:uncharacterized membrane protein